MRADAAEWADALHIPPEPPRPPSRAEPGQTTFVPNGDVVSVRLRAGHQTAHLDGRGPGYNAGEIAGFPRDYAARLVRDGLAEYVEQHEDAST